MKDDIYLTLTDVAEVLKCDISTITDLIASGKLDAIERRGWRISHNALSQFLRQSRKDAFELGLLASPRDDFAFLRPTQDDVTYSR